MKATFVLSALSFATAGAATATDLDLGSIVDRISGAMDKLDDSVKVFSKETDCVQDNAQNLVNVIHTCAQEIQKSDGLGLTDATDLTDLITTVTTKGLALNVDLLSKRQDFAIVTFCVPIHKVLVDIHTAITVLTHSICGILPEDVGNLADKLSGTLIETVSKAVINFAPGENCYDHHYPTASAYDGPMTTFKALSPAQDNSKYTTFSEMAPAAATAGVETFKALSPAQDNSQYTTFHEESYHVTARAYAAAPPVATEEVTTTTTDCPESDSSVAAASQETAPPAPAPVTEEVTTTTTDCPDTDSSAAAAVATGGAAVSSPAYPSAPQVTSSPSAPAPAPVTEEVTTTTTDCPESDSSAAAATGGSYSAAPSAPAAASSAYPSAPAAGSPSSSYPAVVTSSPASMPVAPASSYPAVPSMSTSYAVPGNSTVPKYGAGPTAGGSYPTASTIPTTAGSAAHGASVLGLVAAFAAAMLI